MKQNETYLTGKEVEKLLKISRTTLYRICTEKKLVISKVGKSKRYKLSDVKKMMK